MTAFKAFGDYETTFFSGKTIFVPCLIGWTCSFSRVSLLLPFIYPSPPMPTCPTCSSLTAAPGVVPFVGAPFAVVRFTW